MSHRLAMAALAAFLVPAAAGAEPIFDRLTGHGEDPCFARAYDAAHLARHPRQRVTHIHLARERVEVADENRRDRFTVRIGFRLRGDSDRYATLAVCTPTGRGADCLGEGDSGEFTLSLSGEALRIDVGRLEVEGERGSSPDLAAGDDRVFLMREAPGAACPRD